MFPRLAQPVAIARISIEAAKASRIPTQAESGVVGLTLRCPATFQHVDRGNGRNRTEQFCLSPEKPIFDQPLRPLRIFRRIDIADEIVIKIEANDEHDQAGDEREIDEGEDADDDPRVAPGGSG